MDYNNRAVLTGLTGRSKAHDLQHIPALLLEASPLSLCPTIHLSDRVNEFKVNSVRREARGTKNFVSHSLS
jgi:hypothetical protein